MGPSLEFLDPIGWWISLVSPENFIPKVVPRHPAVGPQSGFLELLDSIGPLTRGGDPPSLTGSFH